MSETALPPASNLKKLAIPTRQAIRYSEQQLVQRGRVVEASALPRLFQAQVAGIDLVSWAASNREELISSCHQAGAVLLRGFSQLDPAGLEAFVATMSLGSLEYKERSSPRSRIAGNIYSSTDHPADQSIFLHNENSYQQSWPRKIFFLSVKQARQGGETPLADCRRVFARISPEVRERFIAKKWMYVRNFGNGFGLPWQTVFQTSDRASVEAYCHDHDIEVQWLSENRLRTRSVRPAVAKHPETGADVWFNHATFFHFSTLPPAVGQQLLAELAVEDLPANSYYGDGSPIEPEVLDHLRAAYQAETVSFPWQEGDVLFADNMLVAHGRSPFVGDRKVLVAMADPMSWSEV